MTASDHERIGILEQRIDELEKLLISEVARLDKANKQAEEGFCAYDDQARSELGQIYGFIRETDRLARGAFYKTHPEVLRDIISAEKITGASKDDGNDPQR
jgi:hypothetical protein